MKCIYKYPLILSDYQTIGLPGEHKILSVQIQGNQLCLWALVDPSIPSIVREVLIVGTGNPFENADQWAQCYVATVQQGRYVWHVFVK